jgi:DNA repair exonuclease SbcCD ATPase subunit
MVLSYRYMAQVVVELNNTLSQIGVPFTIELENDLSFTVNFGFQKVPASRLSGGQKVILTIAYRLAVNFTFATNLGLLCLDEPTVGLDEANLGSLERAFERLKDFSLSNGVQIIVVTHEKGLSHLFDHTIDLTQV